MVDVRPGDTLVVSGPEGHHASSVKRVERGEAIDVVDGRGNRAKAVVVLSQQGVVEARVDSVGLDADRPIVLVQALAKGGRDEAAIEAATELGVTRVVPWAAQRSIVEWNGPKVDKGRERWEAVVMAAAKVARRAWIPDVSPLQTTVSLVSLIAEAVRSTAKVVVLHEEADVNLAELPWVRGTTPDESTDASQETWLIVGPEGGISADEITAFEEAGAQSARLGPHVLRSSTAGPAAIAAILSLGGQWSASIPTRHPLPRLGGAV
jgi:16S rRNA (uracil1498-N3)-methyltransferase